MSAAELKWEIVRTVDHLSEDLLKEALEMVKKLNATQGERLNDQALLDRHFARYDNVLKRLAE